MTVTATNHSVLVVPYLITQPSKGIVCCITHDVVPQLNHGRPEAGCGYRNQHQNVQHRPKCATVRLVPRGSHLASQRADERGQHRLRLVGASGSKRPDQGRKATTWHGGAASCELECYLLDKLWPRGDGNAQADDAFGGGCRVLCLLVALLILRCDLLLVLVLRLPPLSEGPRSVKQSA